MVRLESFILQCLDFLSVKFKSFVLCSVGEEFPSVKFIGFYVCLITGIS